MKALLIALALACLLAARPDHAWAADGDLDWKTIETDHFVIHYYEPNGDIAHRVAVVAERAHRVLAPVLRHQPDEKCQVIITDDTDGANGYATAIPRNQIGLYATAPDALSVLNDHDDWLYGLVAHEYTHILHLDTIEGIPWLWDHIVGKVWAPNNIQPRWFIEGLATYEESRRSSSGRTRNAIFEMYLRVAVLAGKQLDLDAVTASPYFWPHGNAVYLYGSYFLEYLTDRFGDDVLTRVSHEYGSSPVPYGLNRSIAHATGKDYVTLYDEWIAHLRRRYGLERDVVLRRGLREGRKLTDTGEYNSYPRYTRDGAIVWQNDDGHRAARYYKMPAGGTYADAHEILRLDGGQWFTLLPASDGMIVQRSLAYRTNYSYDDLFRVDFAPGQEARALRLTEGMRALTPDISPDGKWLAFTVNGNSRQRLVIMPSGGGGEPTVVWEGGRWDQAYNPAWSPDGKLIAFSTWTTGGYDDIYLYDVAKKTTVPLTHDRAIDVTPRFSPDGKIVYFSSDRTGIYNIYALELEHPDRLWQVTNLVAGAFEFDVSRDGKRIAYQGYDDDGYELYEIAVDRTAWLPAEPYLDDRPDPTEIPDDEARVSPPRTYDPTETLLPRSYTLQTGVDNFGDVIGLSTGGGDVLGQHSWNVGVSYSTRHGDVNFGVNYNLSKFWPSFGVAAGRTSGLAGGLFIDGRNTAFLAENYYLAAGIGLPVLRKPELYSDFVINYDLTWQRAMFHPIVPDPNAEIPVLPRTGAFGGLTFTFYISNARGFVYTLGPVEGRGLTLQLRLEDPAIGSKSRGALVTYRWDEYWAMPWGDQVFAFRLGGGIGQSDQNGEFLFGLGGIPDQDIVQAIIKSTRAGNTWLHGYPFDAFVGHQYHLLNLEYRIPLAIIEKGLATLPVYARRVHLAALFDAGNAFDGTFEPGDLKLAAGVSLRFDLVFGYFVAGSLDLGYARGLSHGGQNEWWLQLTNTL